MAGRVSGAVAGGVVAVGGGGLAVSRVGGGRRSRRGRGGSRGPGASGWVGVGGKRFDIILVGRLTPWFTAQIGTVMAASDIHARVCLEQRNCIGMVPSQLQRGLVELQEGAWRVIETEP